MCACIFYLPYQSGSSLRVDNGFESSPSPRYHLVQGWAQRRKIEKKEERKAREERKRRKDPRKNHEKIQALFDPAALPNHPHPHQVCR